MENVYGRAYELIVTKHEEVIELSIPTSDSLFAQVLVAPVTINDNRTNTRPSTTKSFVEVNPRQKITITDLRIKAKVLWDKESSASSSSQESYIEIYNLSPDNEAFIDASDSVLLSAGYIQDLKDIPIENQVGEGYLSGRLPLICTGQIKYKQTIKKGSDTITKLVIKDISYVTDNLIFSKYYAGGTPYGDIIEDLLSFLAERGVPRGSVYDPSGQLESPPPTVLDLDRQTGIQGLSVYGYAVDQLQEICSKIGYRAYSFLGKMYVEPISTVQYLEYVEVTQDNIKGSIREEFDSSKKLKAQGDTKPGLEFDTFLKGDITLNKALKISVDSPRYRGDYKITSIEHKLDNQGTNWTTVVSCIDETT